MENSEDPFADIWISNWERQCEVELENEPDLDQAVLSERDLSTQKLWYLFQNSATSVAQLFKGKDHVQQLGCICNENSNWFIFLQIVISHKCSGYHFKTQLAPSLHYIKVRVEFRKMEIDTFVFTCTLSSAV